MSYNKKIKNTRNKHQLKYVNKNNIHTKKKSNTSSNSGKYNVIMYAIYKQDDNTITHQKNRCMCFKDEIIKNGTGSLSSSSSIGSKQIRCNKTVITGTDFCPDHQNCASVFRQFTSGYEPEFKPTAWSHPYIEGSHNCYSYFLDDKDEAIKEKCDELCIKKNKNGCPKKISECGDLKPQPGDYFNLINYSNLNEKKRIYQCPSMENNILSDNPSIFKTPFDKKCPKHFYKGAMVVDPDHTFHFYRQNPDATWSHKPGTLSVSKVDADKKTIYAPHFANRNYENDKHSDEPIIYTDVCGYYCIPTSSYMNKNAI